MLLERLCIKKMKSEMWVSISRSVFMCVAYMSEWKEPYLYLVRVAHTRNGNHINFHFGFFIRSKMFCLPMHFRINFKLWTFQSQPDNCEIQLIKPFQKVKYTNTEKMNCHVICWLFESRGKIQRLAKQMVWMRVI